MVERRWWAAAGATALLVFGACSGSDEAGGSDGSRAAQVGRAEYGGSGGGNDLVDVHEMGGAGAESAALVPGLEQSIVKDGSLDIEVRGTLRDAVDEAVRIAGDLGGFVLETSVEEGKRKSATMRLRIPAAEFERALSDLGDLGDVRREEISGQDVTEEFVDLEARLRNLEAQERVLLSLMDDATTVAASIRVQRGLTPVQLDIERIRGRMRFLEDRTSLATIDLVMAEEGVVAAEEGPIERALGTARAGFVSVFAGAIVLTGFLVPIALIALVLTVVVRLVWKRVLPSHG
ncbi:MAG TPA: DUF4349 domain-containing protein [Actinomycetota bacterium]|nr:DUF4349 domain-containing protein [Actinomycetota bacterium]